jgi:ABC-2 type transport system ATP-binding protein
VTAAPSASSPVVEIAGLRKAYGDVIAVDGVDLQIREGEVFALLGPNGAGKTTTVEILEGYRERDAGEVRVLGHDPAGRDKGMLEQIGIVLQSNGVERYLTVREMIDLYRGYYPNPRATDEIIALVGLEEKANARIRTLSGGQRRRLDLAIGLAGNPRLLFLDEPTTGFDPSARHQAWDVVKALTGEGRTVLLTTHFMDEAAYLADRLAIIAAGKIVAEGTPAAIAARASGATTIRVRLPDMAPALPADLAAAADRPGRDGIVELRASDPTRTLHELTSWALATGVALDELTVTRPSLEDAYLQLTGGDVRRAAGTGDAAGAMNAASVAR